MAVAHCFPSHEHGNMYDSCLFFIFTSGRHNSDIQRARTKSDTNYFNTRYVARTDTVQVGAGSQRLKQEDLVSRSKLGKVFRSEGPRHTRIQQRVSNHLGLQHSSDLLSDVSGARCQLRAEPIEACRRSLLTCVRLYVGMFCLWLMCWVCLVSGLVSCVLVLE